MDEMTLLLWMRLPAGADDIGGLARYAAGGQVTMLAELSMRTIIPCWVAHTADIEADWRCLSTNHQRRVGFQPVCSRSIRT